MKSIDELIKVIKRQEEIYGEMKLEMILKKFTGKELLKMLTEYTCRLDQTEDTQAERSFNLSTRNKDCHWFGAEGKCRQGIKSCDGCKMFADMDMVL